MIFATFLVALFLGYWMGGGTIKPNKPSKIRSMKRRKSLSKELEKLPHSEQIALTYEKSAMLILEDVIERESTDSPHTASSTIKNAERMFQEARRVREKALQDIMEGKL